MVCLIGGLLWLFRGWRGGAVPPDVFGGEPRRADVACRGGGASADALEIGPTLPAHGPAIPARLAALRGSPDKNRVARGFWLHRFSSPCHAPVCGIFRVSPHSAYVQEPGSRARGEPSDISARRPGGGRLTLVRGVNQSDPHAQPDQQSEAVATQPGRPTQTTPPSRVRPKTDAPPTAPARAPAPGNANHRGQPEK